MNTQSAKSTKTAKQNSAKSLFALLPFMLWSKQINRQSLLADFLAGLTGAVVVLPQGVAYALIAGLPPEYGLYTAIVTPIIAGLFGSSLHLVSGPTAAISIVVMSVVSNIMPADSGSFIATALVLTLLAGIIQLVLGFARLGTLVNFISHTVVIGFTAGAAILIASSQLKYVTGASVPSGSSFFTTWQLLIAQLGQTNVYSLLIATVTITATLIIKKINSKIPAMLFGMITGSLTCWLLEGADHGVALVGALPDSLPEFSLPETDLDTISAILPGACAVAILGLVEAVSIARAIAIRSGQRIKGNQEFIGQGLSNIIGSFFSCYAGSGSFTRSGINYDSGAQTPMAAIFAAVILALILLLAPEVTAFLPLPAMAGAILLIAWGLVDGHHIAQILRCNKQEAAILLITFISTLMIELEFAIYLGVITSLVLYLRRTSTPTIMAVAPKSHHQGTDLRSIQRYHLKTCPQLHILRIDGSIFFGAVDHIQKTLQEFIDQNSNTTVILLNCSGINFIDLAGAEMLCQESKHLKQQGVMLRLCSLKNTVKDELFTNGYQHRFETDSFYLTVDDALTALIPQLQHNQCAQCTKRVFSQCPKSNTPD